MVITLVFSAPLHPGSTVPPSQFNSWPLLSRLKAFSNLYWATRGCRSSALRGKIRKDYMATWTSKPWYPVPKINRTRSRRPDWDVHHFQIVCLQSTNHNKPMVGLIGWTVFRAHSHFVGSRDFQGWHCGEIMMYSMNTCWAWKVPHHTSPHRSLPCYTTVVSCISHVL